LSSGIGIYRLTLIANGEAWRITLREVEALAWALGLTLSELFAAYDPDCAPE
jgi:hypothetical protein